MELKRNEYQISKTIRFGLTLKEKKSRDGGAVFQSHSMFKDLVTLSENRVKEYPETVSPQDQGMDFFIKRIQDCTDWIEDFLAGWELILTHLGHVELDRDYYKRLTKKIGFNGFWYEDGKKNPQARNVPMSILKHKCQKSGKECADYLKDYWIDLLKTAGSRLHESREQQNKFIKAKQENRNDNKPNEVELKKNVLSLFSIVRELLIPLLDRQILFNKMDRLDLEKDDDRWFCDFVSEYNDMRELNVKMEEITTFFNGGGNNNFFCRATLNPNTALKQHNSNIQDNVASRLNELNIESIVRYESLKHFMRDCVSSVSTKEKMNIIEDESKSLIYRAPLFKYKVIPANVRREIAKHLAAQSNRNEDDIYAFLSDFASPRIPQKDYAELKNKEMFNFEDYPLKVAFDFAWEGLAKAYYHEDIDFPVDESIKFLEDNFGVELSDELNENFSLYMDLIELNALLSTLDKGNPREKREIEGKALKLINTIKWCVLDKNNGLSYRDVFKERIENGKSSRKYLDAMKSVSKSRGNLKNEIKAYDNLTNCYKNIAMKLGRQYASLRDAVMEASELNKVKYYSLIVEDSNSDKYILLQEVQGHLEDNIYHNMSRNPTDLKAYYVNSITSSAIAKMIKKKFRKADYESLREMSEDREREAFIVNKWCRFIREKKYDQQYNLVLSDKNLESLKKEIDSKSYVLERRNINAVTLRRLVEEEGCLLFPIVNQDLAKEVKTESNQFTKDWNAIFAAENNPWRLTPEFMVTYRNLVPNYPVSDIGTKRYSRFQMNVHFVCDYIPFSDTYTSSREQIAIFKDEEKQKEIVTGFNQHVISQGNSKSKGNFYVIGIDRGQVELATLCVVDQDKHIHGGFQIYTRSFNSITKQWEHQPLEVRDILDLSNLRVETTIMIGGTPEKKQVLVDLSEVKVKDKEGNYTKPNKMQIKMQQMAYIRKLQFQMQTNPEGVLEWYQKNPSEELITKNIVDKIDGEKGLISFYGAAVAELEDTLPVQKLKEMLEKFMELKLQESKKQDVKKELDRLTQLEPVDNLKAGVVANMVGVISFILKELNYNAYISLEDLSQGFSARGGITGIPIKAEKNEGRRMDVEKYAGLGLYNFFEMQLLRKLFRIQIDSGNILHLIPAFRAQKNYDNIAVGKEKVKNQFGIVFFVDPNATSIKCPRCGAVNDGKFTPDTIKYPSAKRINNKWVIRDKEHDDRILCYHCGFDTKLTYEENPLKYIKSGDDNAAFLISEQGLKAYELATAVVDEKVKSVN